MEQLEQNNLYLVPLKLSMFTCNICGVEFEEVEWYSGPCSKCCDKNNKMLQHFEQPISSLNLFKKTCPVRYQQPVHINLPNEINDKIYNWADKQLSSLLVFRGYNQIKITGISIIVIESLIRDSIIGSACYFDFNEIKDAYFNKLKKIDDNNAYDLFMATVLKEEGVIIDGLGVEETLTRPERAILLRIVNSRFRDMKVTIINVNLLITIFSELFKESIEHYLDDSVIIDLMEVENGNDK